MALADGTRLGPYHVLSGIGAGGMGEVYRARDTRLERIVAIKVLPVQLAPRADLRERFEREARTVASLNHPHICAVFDVGHQDGVDFLVMEYLEGEPLTARLAKGPLPLEEALRHAIEIAAALDKAHAQGVVHRDLKPGNIMLTRNGAKLLDFGLAKLKQETVPATDPAQLATLAGAPNDLTVQGMVVGTLQYMAPEQAEGKTAQIDARTDIFSFGVVAYEMATGRRAFESSSAAGLLGKILETEPPPMADGQRKIPAAFERIVRKCMRKDPDQRWQSARDLVDALRWVLESELHPEPEAAGAQQRSGRFRGISAAWVAATLLLALASGAVGWWLRSAPAPDLAIRSVHVQRLTDMVGVEKTPALSPDGKTVAFVAAQNGRQQVWVRLLAGGAPLALTQADTDHYGPRWAPDSSTLIYFTRSAAPGEMGAIWEVSALGGPPRRVVLALAPGDISHDGKSLAYLRHETDGIWLTVAARDLTNVRRVVKLPRGSYSNLRWSPDDRWLAFTHEVGGAAFTSTLYAVSSEGGEPRRVAGESQYQGFAWLSDSSGMVVSSAQQSQMPYPPAFNLWKVRLDRSASTQVTFGEASYENPDIGPGGQLVVSRVRAQSDVWSFPVNGTPLENTRRAVRITRQTGLLQTATLSPDGSEVAFLSDNGGHANVWVAEVQTGAMRALTRESDSRVVVAVPAWSPRGDWINFLSSRDSTSGSVTLWLARADGSELRDLGISGAYACWSGDGRWLYYSDQEEGMFRIRKVPVEGGEPVTVRTDNAMGCSVAADGRSLYYTRPLTQAAGVWDLELLVATPEDGEARSLGRVAGWRVPAGAINLQPQLSPDGRWLAMPLLDGSTTNLWAVATATSEWHRLTDFGDQNVVIARRIAWSGDSNRLFASVSHVDSDIIMMTGLL